MDLPRYTGNISGYLGGQLAGGRELDINRALGFDNARSNYEFQAGGDIYRLQNNNNGTRSVTRVGSIADRQAKALQEQTQAREKEFLGRVQGIPDALRGIETELGLPQARDTYQAAGNQVRDVANTIRDVAPTQQTLGKQFGISAPRLQQRIAAETAKLQPSAETATRGLSEAQAGLSGLLGAFDTRSKHVLAPFEIEAGILGDSVKNEFDLFKTNLAANLDRELKALERSNFNDQAALNRAHELALQERATSQGTFTDLGNRVALIDPTTGREISSFSKGKLSTLGGGGAYNPGNI